MRKIKIFNLLGLIGLFSIIVNCSSNDSSGDSNSAPEVQNANLIYSSNNTQNGEVVLVVGDTLSVDYEYTDLENNTEGSTIFSWYRADSQEGSNKENIEGESNSTYIITSADINKYISVQITPVQSDNVKGTTVELSYSPVVVSAASLTWDGESVTSYQIINGEFIKSIDYPVTNEYLSLQQDTAKHQEIIGQFKKIVPEQFWDRIGTFTVFIGEVTGELGRVSYFPNTRDKFDFEIAIDLAYSLPFNNELGLNYTIAHEFGHVLTLNESEASTTDFNESSCTNYFSSTCFFNDSYLNVFYQDFWVPILDEYNSDYYNTHQNEFVSEYAASQTPEDIAETIMMYVLNSVNFTGTTIADQKVQSMNNYSDFQTMRTFATGNIPNSSLRSLNFDASKRVKFVCGTKHNK